MALHELCQLYWQPLCSFVRHSGYGKEDAEDLTQEFLAHVIEKRYLGRVDAEKGKLRSFFLAYLKYFLADKRKAAGRLKRGGGHTMVSLDSEEGNQGLHAGVADTTTPEDVYERSWALTLLELVLSNLEQEFIDEGKGELFRTLKPHLQFGGNTQELNLVAEKLGIKVGAVKVAIYRLRQRYRAALRRQITQTLAEGEDVDDEMRHLFRVLSEKS